jgi:hypothetical protein
MIAPGGPKSQPQDTGRPGDHEAVATSRLYTAPMSLPSAYPTTNA